VREKVTPAYRLAMALTTPSVRWWGGLAVEGLECLPPEGPVLLAGNHDSYWDPVAIGIAGLPRRQIKALAKASLWRIPGLAPVLDGMGQIPIERGASDQSAFARAIEELRAGACVGVFLEGTRSRGRQLRARSGFGRLVGEVPEAAIVLCAVRGTVDLARFPHRPSLSVSFFPPRTDVRDANLTPAELSAALLQEIRARAPVPGLG
jgi:1-acyl-sn-glycerol-3-phosphate acyltransferase